MAPTAMAAGPELSLSVTHSPAGAVKTGEPVTFDIEVQNIGDAPTLSDPILAVSAGLPAGLTDTQVTTDDDAFWTNPQIPDPGCVLIQLGDEGQIACGSDEVLAPGESAPTIHVTGTVSPDATGSVTLEANANGAGAPSVDASDQFAVTPAPILDIEKSHAGLFRLSDEGVYDLALTNTGPKATSGTVTIRDELPTGLSYVSATSDGGYWTCGHAAGVVTCTSDAVIPAGESAPTIRLTVAVAGDAPSLITNTATADGSADEVSGSSSDKTPIYSATAKQIRLSIDPTEVATQAGKTGSFFRLRNLLNDSNVFLDFNQLVEKPVLIGAFEPDNGNKVTIDPSGVSFPTYTIQDLDAGIEALGSKILVDVDVNFTPTAAWTGTYDPVTGEADLAMHVTIDLNVKLASLIVGLEVANCGTGQTDVDPLTTGHQTPVDPDIVPGPVTDGIPFGSDSNGALINNDVAVAGVTCPYVNPLVGALAGLDNESMAEAVNGLLGAPSPAGATDVRLEMHAAFPETNPVLTVRVRPEDKIVLGSGGTYDLSVRNESPVATDGSTITVKDTLPDGLTYVGATGTDWTCSNTGQDVTCTTDSTVPANGSLPTIKLAVDTDGQTAYPSVVNFATVEGGGNEGVTHGSFLTTISAPVLGLSMQSDTGNYVVGNTTTLLRPTVTNSGDLPTSGPITLKGHLPRGLTFRAYPTTPWACTATAPSPTGQDVTCTLSDAIAAGATSTALMYVDIAPAAVPSAHTEWSATGGGSPTDASVVSAERPVVQAELAVSSTHTGDFAVGDEGQYSVVVRNTGFGATAPGSAVIVTDTLPDGLRFVSAGPSANWQCSASGQTVRCAYANASATNGAGTSLAAGASSVPLVITVAVEKEAFPKAINGVTASGGMASNTASSYDVTNVTAAPKLDIAKSHDRDFQAGQEGSFSIDVANDSPVDTDGTEVTVTDTLPAGLTYKSASSDGDYWSCASSGQDVTCTSDAVIPAGDAAPTLSLVTDVGDAAVPGVTNTAKVAGGGMAGEAESSDSVIVNPVPVDPGSEVPIFSIDASHQGDFVAGGNGAYKVTVSNTGKVSSSGTVKVTIALPVGLTYQGASGSGWSCAASGQRVTCTSDAAIAAGASAPVIDLSVKVGGDAVPGVTATASVEGGGAVAQAISVDPTKVNPAPKARITAVKVSPKQKKVKAGKTVKLTVKVKNGGNARAGGVKVCATGPKAKVKLPRCVTRSIAAGATATVKLKVKTKKKAKGNAAITVKAGSGGAGTKSAKATLKIRRA